MEDPQKRRGGGSMTIRCNNVRSSIVMPVASLVCKVKEVESDYGKRKPSKVVRPGICKGRSIYVSY